MRDPETPIEDIRPYLTLDPCQSSSFAPAVTFNEKLVDDEGLEGGALIGLLNGVSRFRRAARYRKRIREGYSGLRIVSEGDSWFQYPLLLDDVIDQLSKDYAIRSLGGAGHTLADIVAQDEITDAVERERADILLISGGGNDLLGDGMIKSVLKPYSVGRSAEDYLNATFDRVLDEVSQLYRGVFTRLTGRFPRLKILTHGYDHAIPAEGKWLGDPMADLKIVDPGLQAAIVKVLIDRFNDMQQSLAAEFPRTVRHVDCRGFVGAARWNDELHPTSNGFAAVASKFDEVINDIAVEAELHPADEPLCPGMEGMLKDPQDLSAATFRRIVAIASGDGKIQALVIDEEARRIERYPHGLATLLESKLCDASARDFRIRQHVMVGHDEGREVEVPDFRGTPDFADLGFWNIEHFNAGISEQRLDRVADVLSRLNMDVMGLTEVHPKSLDRLKVAMRARGDAVDFVLENAPGSQDLAVLFDTDTTTVVRADAIAKRHANALNARTPAGRTAFPRKPLFAHCKVVDDNSVPVEFMMIVVHLKAFGDAQSRARRRLAAGILADIIEDIRATERLPIVLGGDFNEQLNNDVLAALSGAPDLFALTADDALTGAASFIGGRRRSLIDHIITSRDVMPGDISGDDAAIVRLDRSVRDFSDTVSDHVPVVMRLVLRDAPLDVGEPEDPGSAILIDVPEGAKHALLEFQD